MFEGCDRVGKTTQIQKLADALCKEHQVKVFKFPDRSTTIGKLIDEFLQRKKTLDDHVVHLLFSANRWECIDEIRKQVEAGTTVLVDRYVYSGVAYSSAKEVSGFLCVNRMGLLDWTRCLGDQIALKHPTKRSLSLSSFQRASRTSGVRAPTPACRSPI